MEAEITAITAKPWARRVITWQLDGEQPKDLRLTWAVDTAARAGLAAELFGKHVLITDHHDWPVTDVVAGYRSQSQEEKSFRMAKSDLQARPVYHHLRGSIEAHLTIVFAALAVSRWIEQQTDWSVRKFVKTARRYRIVQIQAGPHVITAAAPLPGDLRQAFDRIHGRA